MKQAAAGTGIREREFPLAPLQRMTWPILLGLWGALLLAGFLTSSHEQSPHNPVPWWLVIVFGTALVPAGLLSMLAHRTISIEGDTLVVSAALIFWRKLPVANLALDKARVLNLDEHTGFKPLFQLVGFDFPGFSAGTHLLRNRSRAFVLLTRREHVLLLPTRDGNLLLLSPEKPQALLCALRDLAASATPR